MPGFIGLKLCPELQLIPGKFHLYKEESRKITEVLKEYDETFTPYSLDEASINLTDYLFKKCSLPNSKVSMEIKENSNGELILADEVWELAKEVVQEIRTKVFEKTQLTCSAGIAPNKMLAKICSDINKPNNQFMLKGTSSEDLVRFVHKLNVKKIPGIGENRARISGRLVKRAHFLMLSSSTGPVQQQTLLKGFGIETVEQLHDQLETLMLVYTLNQMEYFTRISLGISSFETSSADEPRKSESREETFSATNDQTFLLKTLRELCERLCSSLVRHGNLKGKTVTLKIKKDTFEVNVRSKTIANYVNDAETVYEVGKKLLLNEMAANRELRLRLIGIRLSNFQEENEERNQQTRIDDLFKKKPEDSIQPVPYTSSANGSGAESSDQTVKLSELNDSSDLNGSPDAAETTNSFLCPVCSIRRFSALDQLNDHIDYCLSRDCIMSSVKEFNDGSLVTAEQTSAKRKPSTADGASPKKKKIKEITEYFGKI